MEDIIKHMGRVLLVDADPEVCEAIGLLIEGEGYGLQSVGEIEDAIGVLKQEHVSVVIVGGNVEGEGSGEGFLKKVLDRWPKVARVLLVREERAAEVVHAMAGGEVDYLLSVPWSDWDVFRVLRECILLNGRRIEEAKSFAQPIQENILSDGVSFPWGGDLGVGLCFSMLHRFCPLAAHRTKLVGELCRRMSLAPCFSEEERRDLNRAAWLYDIGLVGVRQDVVQKIYIEGVEEESERDEFNRHVVFSEYWATFIGASRGVAAAIRGHHERYDGAGYPDRLAREAIPWIARCLAVAVAFVDCGLSRKEAVQSVEAASGGMLDPEAVRVFFQMNRVDALPLNVREVQLAELKAGMKLARPVVTGNGVLLFPQDFVMEDASIQKIDRHSRLDLLTQRLIVFC